MLYLLPLAVAQLWLVPAYSGKHREMLALRAELSRTGNVTTLVLGDSTASRLRDTPSTPATWLDLGLGGSTLAEWGILLEDAIEAHPGLRRIFVVAAPANLASAHSVASGPYVSYLLGPRRIFRLVRSGELSPAAGARLFWQHYLLVNANRSELLYELLKPLPALRPWSARLLFGRGSAGGDAATMDTAQDWQDRSYARIASVAREHGIPLTLVQSPLHSLARAENSHQAGREVFERVCRQPGWKCLDLERRFPDGEFTSDHVHLQPAWPNETFVRLIEGAGG